MADVAASPRHRDASSVTAGRPREERVVPTSQERPPRLRDAPQTVHGHTAGDGQAPTRPHAPRALPDTPAALAVCVGLGELRPLLQTSDFRGEATGPQGHVTRRARGPKPQHASTTALTPRGPRPARSLPSHPLPAPRERALAHRTPGRVCTAAELRPWSAPPRRPPGPFPNSSASTVFP